MNYPLCLDRLPSVFPLIGELSQSDPFEVSLSDKSAQLDASALRNQAIIQDYVEQQYQNGYTWGISHYLEYREPLLRIFPQMCDEKRFFHLGVDIIAPQGTPLYAPLDGVVESSMYEVGQGNYGGLVILKHTGDFETFYSLYGHLDRTRLPEVDTHIPRGTVLGYMGDFHTNGDWFYHTHLQILTKKGYEDGWASRGYCTAEQVAYIDLLCPTPMHLFTKKHSPIHS